ncbi:MAG: hypothetical protein M1827_003089 [Pycnora praestabilis]|nr:MAG: hypothetical protein M1827_003089 [Pycnora praestabilis]
MCLTLSSQGHRLSLQERNRRASLSASVHSSRTPLLNSVPLASNSPLFNPGLITKKPSGVNLPAYIKPLPARITPDDVEYLQKKGALSIPEIGLRDELLRSYVEYVHGYMPLIELHDFLRIVERNDGESGRISLLLFQAIMFVGTAFIDEKYLRDAGFPSRKAARKSFFQKTRLLYDFDYEIDRISLVQALLLMTYWYETPDDQKDTWHWMGVAISLSHTIGLHRNPEKSNMDIRRQRLWKRIWWSCFMRDRLVALGMRRPTRIKKEDYDVPMLTLDDFELEPVANDITCISSECTIARDVEKQRQIAVMCIEKAKLCLCISHVLSAQYSVLNHNQGRETADGHTTTTMMLLPKKLNPETCDVHICDQELKKWVEELPDYAVYQPVSLEDLSGGRASFVVHRALLHMVYFTTLSALHRPQVLPSAPAAFPARNPGVEIQDISRRKVRQAATEITRIAQDLQSLDLVRYLPTTGVTVLLPAVIIHLLDIKSLNEETRKASLKGFCQCMQVMQRLRDSYAAADFATQFLEAAIRKADIQVAPKLGSSKHQKVLNAAGLVDAGRRTNTVRPFFDNEALTPPPETTTNQSAFISDQDVVHNLEKFLSASTPPDSEESEMASENQCSSQSDMISHAPESLAKLMGLGCNSDIEKDFDSLINFDDTADSFGLGAGDGAMPLSVHGESGGFTLDMDWMKDMKDLDNVEFGTDDVLNVEV